MNVQLENSALKELVQKAIFDSLDQTKRDALVRDAIAHMLAPSTDSWNRGVSPMQAAFRDAAEKVTRDLVREQLAADAEFKAKLGAIVTAALAKAVATDEVVDSVTKSILNGLAPNNR